MRTALELPLSLQFPAMVRTAHPTKNGILVNSVPAAIRTDLTFDKALFWDIEEGSLDLQTHARFIIERIVSRGNRADWQRLKAFYGKEKIREEALQIRSLDQKTVSFLCVYFGVEKKDFRCCK